MRALAERSAVVLAGKVVRTGASLEPLQAASPRTVVISVTRMYAGAEIAGDQRGRSATVVLDGKSPEARVGEEAIFFGNPRFVGKTLTLTAEGTLPAAVGREELEAGVQARRDLPVRERIAIAQAIFIGKVETVRGIERPEGREKGPREPVTEHDPEWRVASVRVGKALSGAEAGALVQVVFPESHDIMWFNSPKLEVGQEALFIAHPPANEGPRLTNEPGIGAFLEKQRVVVVSEPFDTLPPSDEARVRKLLAKGR